MLRDDVQIYVDLVVENFDLEINDVVDVVVVDVVVIVAVVFIAVVNNFSH